MDRAKTDLDAMNAADWTFTAPSLADFERLAERAFSALPEPFCEAAGNVVIHVLDFAEDDVLDEMGIEDPFDLSGLYQGVDIRRQSITDPTPYINRIFLYRRPILDEWCARGDVALDRLIEHVLVHEIGHHMGLSDDDIDTIEAQD